MYVISQGGIRVKRRVMALLGAMVLMTSMFANVVRAETPATVEELEEVIDGFDLASSEVEKITDAIASKYIGKDMPGASIAIIYKGEVVLQKGYGVADVEADIDVSATDTFMEAGSTAKLFVWTAVMQLVESGDISLDADIREYLPENYLELAFEKPITMTHLMTHTAGFEEKTELAYVYEVSKLMPLEEYLSKRYAPKQIYEPGTTVGYSNYGTNLAGLIVERVSGKPFTECIKEKIFSPLGMDNSYFEADYSGINELINGKAKGYAKTKKGFEAVPNIYINDMPAGALITTIEDMALFMYAHMDKTDTGNKLFENPEMLTQMHTTLFSQDNVFPVNAHGFWESIYGGKRTIGHGGNTVGFTSNFIIDTEGDTGICILTNVAKDISGLGYELINTFIGSDKMPVTEYSGELHSKEVAGEYSSSRKIETRFGKLMYAVMGGSFIVTPNANGGITLHVPMAGISSEYKEVSPYLFVRVHEEETMMDKAGLNLNRLYFIRDSKGDVTALSFGSVDISLKKSFAETAGFTMTFLVISFVVFSVGVIWSLRSRAKQRKLTGEASKLVLNSMFDLSVLGLILFLNVVIQMGIFISEVTLKHSVYYPNIFISLVILLLQIIAMFFTIKNLRKGEQSILKKSYRIVLCIITVANIAFFYSYNFYSLR